MNHILSRRRADLPGKTASVALALLGAACLLGVLALAGCGVTTTGVGGSGGMGSGSPNPGGPRLPAGSPTSSGPITGTAVRPCVGNIAAHSKTPTIVLTVKNSHQTTQAHIGDVIEIDLPAKMHWNTPDVSANKTLTPLQPQGAMDDQAQTCRWVYQASAAGTATLSYVGVMICESGVACPAVAEDEAFTIRVA